MQLTSTTDAAASDRSDSGSVLARLNQPLVVGIIGFIGWLIYVIARWKIWAGGHVSLFIMSGSNDKFSHPKQMYPRISHVPSTGYDGQFYYRFAFSPFNWHSTAYGITVDHNYRYTRIGYSLVAYIISLGGHGRLLPTVLVVVNLICVGLMAWLGAKLARESGRHALWGLLLVAYFGLSISVGRDTSEPLADACMLGGLLLYRHSRFIWAALLIAYAVFTNEPVLVLCVAIAVTRLYLFWLKRAKPGLADLVWVLPAVVYGLLQVAEKVVVKGKSGGVADASSNLTLPFKALVPGVYRDIRLLSFTHLGTYDYNLIEFIALAVTVLAAFWFIRTSAAPLHEKVAFSLFVLVEMVIASGQFWDSTFGDGRTFIDAFLLAIIVLLAVPAGAVAGTAGAVAGSAGDAARRARVSLGERVFSAERFLSSRRLGYLAVIVFVVLVLVARRHVLTQ